ncbi:MAG: hypothetical protein WBB45_10130 [Cyclobacteriaceae bacterium]
MKKFEKLKESTFDKLSGEVELEIKGAENCCASSMLTYKPVSPSTGEEVSQSSNMDYTYMEDTVGGMWPPG